MTKCRKCGMEIAEDVGVCPHCEIRSAAAVVF